MFGSAWLYGCCTHETDGTTCGWPNNSDGHCMNPQGHPNETTPTP